MNALLGTDRLPVGTVPVTSAITTVLYGSTESVVVRYEKGGPPREVSLAALPDYITQRGNPGNQRNVVSADIYLPAELLRRGLALIDTPGLGSAVVENSRTTEAFFPEADALLLVTSYDSPLSEDEVRFIERARVARTEVFVALNKHDIVTKSERNEVQAYVAERLGTLTAATSPILSVSARDGLQAKLGSKAALLEESGIPALEAALLEFLLARKIDAFLRQMTDRVTNLVASTPLGPERFRLLDALQKDNESPLTPQLGDRTEKDNSIWIRPIGRCDVCANVAKELAAFFQRLPYELSASDAARKAHAARRGLCGSHTWQYEAYASPLGIAVGYPELLRGLASSLVAGARWTGSSSSLRGTIDTLVAAGLSCLACAARADGESRHVAALARRLDQTSFSEVVDLTTLCLPHLRLTVAAMRDERAAAALARREAAMFDRLAEDLQRLALRHDALRRDLLTIEEREAPRRALALLSGERHLYGSSASD